MGAATAGSPAAACPWASAGSLRCEEMGRDDPGKGRSRENAGAQCLEAAVLVGSFGCPPVRTLQNCWGIDRRTENSECFHRRKPVVDDSL